jgi:hypothetical protein
LKSLIRRAFILGAVFVYRTMTSIDRN